MTGIRNVCVPLATFYKLVTCTIKKSLTTERLLVLGTPNANASERPQVETLLLLLPFGTCCVGNEGLQIQGEGREHRWSQLRCLPLGSPGCLIINASHILGYATTHDCSLFLSILWSAWWQEMDSAPCCITQTAQHISVNWHNGRGKDQGPIPGGES